MTTATGTLAKELLGRVQGRPVQIVPIEVATQLPLTVYIDGDTSLKVPARFITGQVFDPGFTGMAIWQPPQKPVVFSLDDDTGWINMTYSSGTFTAGTPGQLAYRRIGQEVWIRGGASMAGNYPNTGAQQTVATLPVGARPGGENLRTATMGQASRPGSLEITTAGAINLASPDTNGALAVSWLSASCKFLAD